MGFVGVGVFKPRVALVTAALAALCSPDVLAPELAAWLMPQEVLASSVLLNWVFWVDEFD
jgi:hypothetical protein